jgi:hypothetical protein
VQSLDCYKTGFFPKKLTRFIGIEIQNKGLT